MKRNNNWRLFTLGALATLASGCSADPTSNETVINQQAVTSCDFTSSWQPNACGYSKVVGSAPTTTQWGWVAEGCTLVDEINNSNWPNTHDPARCCGANSSVEACTIQPAGFIAVDVGTTGAQGSTNESGGNITIVGSGHDIWHTSDEFHYYQKAFTGDAQITVRLNSVTNTHVWTKAGVMIRDSLAKDAKNAFMFIRPTEGAGYQYRNATGGTTGNIDAPYVQPPRWLRLTRVGNQLTGYTSHDGLCWDKRGSQTVVMLGIDHIGLALTANNFGILATAQASDLEVSETVEPFNSECPRAQIDGRLPAPTRWIAAPATVAPSSWDYTTQNPNVNPTLAACTYESGQGFGPDDPQCPLANVSPAWTQQGYSPNPAEWSTGNAGFGSGWSPEGDVVSTAWTTQNLWLRKAFSVPAGDIDDLVLYGRWNDGLTVYINGVLATWNRKSTQGYRYIGISDAARATITLSGNVIAVRVKNGEWEKSGGTDRYFDLGIGVEGRMAQLPVTPGGIQTIPEVQAYVDATQKLMVEQGISGGTMAVMRHGEVVVAKGFGYNDKDLSTPMPYDALMRLASVDKVITQAAIQKLIADGQLASTNELAFPLFGSIDPVPGQSVGDNVNSITVEHLLRHTSGICCLGEGQYNANQKYHAFGIQPAQYNKLYNLRWLYSLNTSFEPGKDEAYSSDGYYVLRHLVEHLSGQSMNDYLKSTLLAPANTTDMYVAHERLSGRDPREPGYIVERTPDDRWINLENYFALGASSEALVRFLRFYSLANGKYLLDAQGNRIQHPGGGFFGSMDGTFSFVAQHNGGEFAFAVVFNSGGYYDEIVKRLSDVTDDLMGPGGPWN